MNKTDRPGTTGGVRMPETYYIKKQIAELEQRIAALEAAEKQRKLAEDCSAPLG